MEHLTNWGMQVLILIWVLVVHYDLGKVSKKLESIEEELEEINEREKEDD